MSTAVYDSQRRRVLVVEELVELLRYRDLLRHLVSRDIKVRYKRSALGVAWTMLNPLLTMVVLTVVFSTLFRFAVPHYPVYLLSGLLCWNFFAQSTTSAMSQMIWTSDLLKRIYVPRAIFAVSAICTGLVNLTLAMLPLLLVVLATGLPLNWTWLFLPLPVLLISMFALGVGLLLSTLAAYFADVVDMYQILLTALMYLTPVFYPTSIIPQRFLPLLYLNPMYHLLESFRAPIYLRALPSLETLLIGAGVAVVTLVVGWWFFSGKTDEFAYRV